MIVAITVWFSSIAFADNWKEESKKEYPHKSRYAHDNYEDQRGQNQHDNRRDRNRNDRYDRDRDNRYDHRDRYERKDRYDRHDRRDGKDHWDYSHHHGYSKRPHDRGRHYGHHKYRGRSYDYHGHWRSWNEWDGYVRSNPRIYRHGHYYRENSHLMFRFCDPDTGGCFFFSIGQ